MRIALSAILLAIGASTVAAADTDEGRHLYQTYCTQCHGIEGNGKGINSTHMSVIPRAHTDRTEMSGRSDDQLFKVVKHGGKSINQSILMPAWGGNLSDEQINALVRYLRKLCCE